MAGRGWKIEGPLLSRLYFQAIEPYMYWKNAEPNILILKKTMAQYAKLQQ
jgi:hypothetical protein